ncbi:replication protein [Moraxella bovis]|uniref:Phage replication protein O, N-terminal domain n=1 Tax=Moraxella bovis TaxID=476 RepID=A0A378PXX8_MORBO|nr:replication protein [Moraxella bovis]STY93411.1 phage replication protein O, N-terminal domain [Moraxella bovis]
MSKFIANSFQLPNAFVDEMLCKLSGNACKIYLLIVRKTRGWHKEADRISYSQIQKYTGINHRATVSKAIDELLEIGLISVQKGNEKSMSEYRLNDDFCGSKNEQEAGSKNEPVKKCTSSKNEPTGSKNEQEAGSKNEHTEIHYIKNTKEKYREYDTHTHETQTDENHQNAKKPKTTSSVKKSKSLNDKLTADDLMNLKLSDFNFSNDDFENIPNLGDWLFDNLDYQVVNDFIATRKTKLTITAVKMIVKQSALANINLNSALEFCIDAGWQSFKADWYFNRQQPKQTHFNQQPTNRMDELRQLAQNAPVNEFGDFPFEQNFHQPATIGVNHE